MLAPEKIEPLRRVGAHLATLQDRDIDDLIDSGKVLFDPEFLPFLPSVEGSFGQFYAPFDWMNETADVVLIGITPGMRQAKTALKVLRAQMLRGASIADAASAAKQSASFEGSMRTNAPRLMDRFRLNRLLGLGSCDELFGRSAGRAHYTSLLRYPVLRLAKGEWSNYSGSPKTLHRAPAPPIHRR